MVGGSDIRNVAVIGAGLMGHGIALDFALSGYNVRLHSRTENSLKRGFAMLQSSVQRLIKIGVLKQDESKEVLEKVTLSSVLSDSLADVDLVVESVYENVELKRRVFQELGRIAPRAAILASNTSGIMPSKFALDSERPDKVLVTHYANPPFLIPTVELVRTQYTSDETISKVCDFYAKLGKRPIVAQKEVPGFILNRLQLALFREALWLVENGVATPQDVDFGIKSSIGRRWSVAGVFEVFELAGLDLASEIGRHIFPHLSTEKEVPRVLLEKVASGDVGAKSGKGFYEWAPESVEELQQRVARALVTIESWQDFHSL
ncbi:MAG: 3-hydroxyacyl-CoA dehydrogenase family protein [SAR202 cluster bacterium]|jgi:3-hydroxybutyryl-CoA dehydrogenase|nr:3-hydroxyacyl-CoA dehydrogenase family protein [SAR202 cluster bacterium]